MKVDKQAFCRVLAVLWRGLHVVGKVGMGVRGEGGYGGGVRRGGGMEGRAGLLWDLTDTDMQPFVVSLTVCFQRALCMHCGFTYRTACAAKITHCISERNRKPDIKVEMLDGKN